MEAFEAEQFEVLWHTANSQSAPKTSQTAVWNFIQICFGIKPSGGEIKRRKGEVWATEIKVQTVPLPAVTNLNLKMLDDKKEACDEHVLCHLWLADLNHDEISHMMFDWETSVTSHV